MKKDNIIEMEIRKLEKERKENEAKIAQYEELAQKGQLSDIAEEMYNAALEDSISINKMIHLLESQSQVESK